MVQSFYACTIDEVSEIFFSQVLVRRGGSRGWPMAVKGAHDELGLSPGTECQCRD